MSPLPRLSNQTLFRLHGWLGLNLGLLLFVVCFSGAIATISHEIDWVLNPSLRTSPPHPGASFTSWTSWYEAAQEAHPTSRILTIDAPVDPRSSARVTVAYATDDWRYVMIDPYSSRVTGTLGDFSVVRFFRSFHKQFYIYPGRLPHGVYAVGPLGLVLLLSLLTGLSFYRFRWRDLFLRGPWRTPRAYWSALHRATGMWTVPVALLITATGAWYLVERVMQDTGVRLPAGQPASLMAPADASRTNDPWPLPVEGLVARAEALVPGFHVTAVGFGRRPADPVTLTADIGMAGARPGEQRTDRSVHGRHRPRDAARQSPAGDASGSTADVLHFGAFGGWVSKLLWLLAGCSMCASILLGVRLWYLRTSATAGEWRRGMGAWSALAVSGLVTTVAIYGCVVNIGQAVDQSPRPRLIEAGRVHLGAVDLDIAAASVGDVLHVRATPSDAARERFAQASVALRPSADSADSPTEAVPLVPVWGAAVAQIALPRGASPENLAIALEETNGQRVATNVPLSLAVFEPPMDAPVGAVPAYVWVVIGAWVVVTLVIAATWLRWVHR